MPVYECVASAYCKYAMSVIIAESIEDAKAYFIEKVLENNPNWHTVETIQLTLLKTDSDAKCVVSAKVISTE